jgi:hypothetical protein
MTVDVLIGALRVERSLADGAGLPAVEDAVRRMIEDRLAGIEADDVPGALSAPPLRVELGPSDGRRP